MKHRRALSLRRLLSAVLALAGIALANCGPDALEPASPPTGLDPAVGTQPPNLAAALAAQARHTDRLLRVQGIVGTAVGLGPNGQVEVQLYTRGAWCTRASG
jgi:hypothetical protein